MSQSDEKTLRYLLWIRHGCEGLYGDDGEMQCGDCLIDFKRMPVKDIEFRFQQIGLQKWAEKQLVNQQYLDRVWMTPSVGADNACRQCGMPTFGALCASCSGEKR